MLVEQAIFTSAQTHRSDGYHLVAASPGILETDSRELAAWGPSHDSLWDTGISAVSVNFHRLPSGAFCISQTTPAGGEHSQRRGPQVYTQSLVVSPAFLASFDNSPFALFQAAIAQGAIRLHEKPPKRLDPIDIAVDGQSIREDLLAPWCLRPGSLWLPALVDAAISQHTVGIVAGDCGPRLIAALVHCLPISLRPCISFTTGLRFSLRRPFQLICLPDTPHENRRLQRQHQLVLFDPECLSTDGSIFQSPWAALIAHVLESGYTFAFTDELARLEPIGSWHELPIAAEQIYQRLALRTSPSTTTRTENPARESVEVKSIESNPETDRVNDESNQLVALSIDETAAPEGVTGEVQVNEQVPVEHAAELINATARLSFSLEEPSEIEPAVESGMQEASRPVSEETASPALSDRASLHAWQRADGFHDVAQVAASAVIADVFVRETEALRHQFEITEEPAVTLAQICPQAEASLQRLEDTIFEVFAGKGDALAELKLLWPEVLAQVGRRFGDATREQYLRYAVAVWRQFTSGGDTGDPERAANAMEAICMLFDS